MAKKKNPTARYGFIALLVALAACIATGFVGLFKGLVSLGLYTPENPQTLNLALSISAGLILVGLATFAILDPDRVRKFLTGRQARYGSNALILSLAVIGIVFIANMLAFQNPKTLLDMTEDQSHTLAKETIQALSTLPGKVQAIAFYSSSLPRQSAEDLLRDFKSNSNGKFDYQFVDPDLDPIQARQAGVTGDGKIMLVMGDHKEIASFASESELTRTLIRLISPDERVIYFLVGHGEADIAGSGDTSLALTKSTLESKNYIVRSLNLLTDHKIPDDALSIVIAGPLKPLSSQEISLLKKYLDAGGGLVVMEDPIAFTEFGDTTDPLASYLADAWGVTLDNDVILDVSTQNPLQAVSATFTGTHPITQNLTSNYLVILPRARSLSITTTPENVTATPLIFTSDQSWGEANFVSAEGTQISYDEGVDVHGPLNMAIAADNSQTQGRVVVFGNSLFATDQNFDAYGNGNILINSIDWTAEQENLINITPHEPITRTFYPPQPLEIVLLFLGVVILIPGLVVVAGVSSWISRRRRG